MILKAILSARLYDNFTCEIWTCARIIASPRSSARRLNSNASLPIFQRGMPPSWLELHLSFNDLRQSIAAPTRTYWRNPSAIRNARMSKLSSVTTVASAVVTGHSFAFAAEADLHTCVVFILVRQQSLTLLRPLPVAENWRGNRQHPRHEQWRRLPACRHSEI